MKCPNCGAEADHRKYYCTVCGTKLTRVGERIQKTAFVSLKQNVPQETTDPVTPKTGTEFLRTHAALEEIFGPEDTWKAPSKTTLAEDTWNVPPKNTLAEDTWKVPPKNTLAEDTWKVPSKNTLAEDTWKIPPKNTLQEDTWKIPLKNTLQEVKEDHGFPVTPCTDWPVNEEADVKDSLPVYTTAPLRQDVAPMAVSVPEETELPEPVTETALKLPEGRNLAKMVLFGLLTLGIYPTVIWSRIVTELNIAASRNDSKRTMPYFGMLILAPVTLSVFLFVWMHQFCNRVGKQLELRQCEFRFNAKDFWIWGVLGSLILVGPFVFTHKLMHSMNLINKHYNKFG